MHGISHEQFIASVASFLGPYYIVLACMNAVAAFLAWKKGTGTAFLWVLFAFGFTLLAGLAGSGIFQVNMGSSIGHVSVAELPQTVRNFIDSLAKPVLYTAGTTLLLVIVFFFRDFFVKPAVAWTIWNGMLLFLGLAIPDKNFYAIVAKPDNVPIVLLIFLLAFFTWLGTYQAVINDNRKEKGLPPLEKEGNDKVLVWPDLVYIELICMIAITALLIFWAMALQAPLEEAASAVKTPNPSKAPWYFLGLQEMLVYFDPWMAGIILPVTVVIGLMAIPYLDFNKEGNGYYTIKERKFSYVIFQIGFLEMWITLIVLGTLLRGPNWNFFGPFEYWEPHKTEALTNINLSELFWQNFLGRSLPKAPLDSPALTQAGYILFRELPGILLVLGYFIVAPAILAVTVFRKFYMKMGLIRVMIMMNLLLLMMSLPIKMILRWSFNLKYLVSIPEYFLNF